MTITDWAKTALCHIYRTVGSLDRSIPVAERRERLDDAIATHTAGLDRDELLQLIYGLAAMLERLNYR